MGGLAAIIFLAILSPATQTRTVQAAATNVQLKQVLSSPDPYESSTIKKFVAIVHTAISNQVPISPSIVDVAAKRFIEGSRENPAAWQGTLVLLDYHSTLNRETSILQSRTCTNLQSPSAGPLIFKGFQFVDFRFSNCTQELDDLAWKNSVFESVTIIYHGGPTKLENVQFRDCQFSVDNTPNGQKFAKSLLASNHVTFAVQNN